MTFASLLLEIRRRAASIPADVPRPAALEQAVRQVIDGQPAADAATRVLAALVGLRHDGGFDASILDSLTPETVLQLDLIAGDVIDHGREKDALRAIRAALIRPVT